MISNTFQSILSDFPFPSVDGRFHPHSNLNAFMPTGPSPVDLDGAIHQGGLSGLWHSHTGYKSIPPWRVPGAFLSEVPQSHQQPSCTAPSTSTATSTQTHTQTAKHKHTSAQPFRLGDRTRVLPLRKEPTVPWAAEKPRPPCCNQDLTVRVPPHHVKSDIHLAYTGRDDVPHFPCAAIYFCNYSNPRKDLTHKHAKKCEQMHQIKDEYSSRLYLQSVTGEPNPDEYQYTVRLEVFAAYFLQLLEASSSQSTISSRRSSPTPTPPPTPVDQTLCQQSYASGLQTQWQAQSSLPDSISIAEPPDTLSVADIPQPLLEAAALKGFDDNIFGDLPPLSVLDDDDDTSFGYLPPSPKPDHIEDLELNIFGVAHQPSADQANDSWGSPEAQMASEEDDMDPTSANIIDELFRSVLPTSWSMSFDTIW